MIGYGVDRIRTGSLGTWIARSSGWTNCLSGKKQRRVLPFEIKRLYLVSFLKCLVKIGIELGNPSL